jgi:hypothetical protein
MRIKLERLTNSGPCDLTSPGGARKTLVFHLLITCGVVKVAHGRDGVDINAMLSRLFAIEARASRERMGTHGCVR